jgi:putative colanic acid biosynthesis acetyltransferase WcaF
MQRYQSGAAGVRPRNAWWAVPGALCCRGLAGVRSPVPDRSGDLPVDECSPAWRRKLQISYRGSIPSSFSFGHKARRALWAFVRLLVFRPSPMVFHGWRRLVLRMMGARIGRGAVIHPTARVWAPWNLAMEPYSCIGADVDCYNVAPITLGTEATISQYTFLCAATHDYTRLTLPLVARPISIGAHVWICADAFIGPGVDIGDGAVVAARASVYGDVRPWTVVGGNPAKILKERVLAEDSTAVRTARSVFVEAS